MKDIHLGNLNNCYYQPNVVIAILLNLYRNFQNTYVIDKKNLKISESDFNNFLNFLIDTIKLDDTHPLIDKIDDTGTITLKIDGFCYDNVAHEDIKYTTYFKTYLSKYVENLKNNSLRDSRINLPSWKTLYSGFIDSIDTSCILNDYKLQGLQYIQLIAYYVLNNTISINWLNITPKFTDNDNMLADSSWDVSMSLSLGGLFRKIEADEIRKIELESRKPVKYTAREIKLIKYIEERMDDEGYRLEPEQVLEVLNPDGHSDGVVCKNKYKFVSNFISRLNKKYMHNTGRKLVKYKEFRNCYVLYNDSEESEDF